ncbi:unnamed protein product [Spirodela intermedia]|uniref:Uncharacterized protein n=1 Tax=Spirodela intermedia TaxID=51605 RepID=A0A7I8JRJ2_SPIIN|nr:unnamed protein product [Spirodela intermedia]CAA6672788.1 unnamed protein product [Spirodela intermedia]
MRAGCRVSYEGCGKKERKKNRSLPVEEKTITPTSASQSMASSSAFLNRPLLRFEKVTCLVVVFSIFLIFIFSLTIPPFSKERNKPKRRRRVLELGLVFPQNSAGKTSWKINS